MPYGMEVVFTKFSITWHKGTNEGGLLVRIELYTSRLFCNMSLLTNYTKMRFEYSYSL